MFYNSSDSHEYNDCISHGACSISPNISSMQEIMFILLRHTAYYLLKLKDFGINNEDATYDIIAQLAFIDCLKDLSDKKVLEIFAKQYANFIKIRKEYLKLCSENGTACNDLKNLLKFSAKTNLSSILKRGDREFLQKSKKLGLNEKYYYEILSAVVKSVSVNWINLCDYDKNNIFSPESILNALNLFNSNRISLQNIKYHIDKLAKYDIELLKCINELQTEKFGKIELTSVSTSTRPHKTIMVSGSNLNDLKSFLDTLQEDIDVYTNGNLLIAHAFPFFNSYKNLKGHFGSGAFNTILDFATFPGAILLTRNETPNIEYLYRGRLFTTDKNVAKGVVKLDNNDFTPLVNSALQAKGFAKGQERKPVLIGYNETELINKLDEVIEQNAEKIFIIGPSNLSVNKVDYFKNFFCNMPKNSFAISFSYNPNKENVLHINIGNDYAVLYGVLRTIFQKIPINSDKLAFFLTKCDVNSLSNIINLKNNGAKNVFLSDCPPLVINPAVLKAFIKLYNINEITTPKEDLEKLKNGEC